MRVKQAPEAKFWLPKTLLASHDCKDANAKSQQ